MPGDLTVHRLSEHVLRIPVPTLTLPPADETNTYVVYDDKTAVIIDCGSAEPAVVHQIALSLKDFGIERIQAYVATHYHLDHTGGIPLLKERFPAPVYLHPLDITTAAQEMHCQPEEITPVPDTLVLGGVTLHIQHRPGHTHGHLHVLIEPDGLLVVGDHMAGIGTVWIGPPDGHMDAYYKALQDISATNPILALPGHGTPIEQPAKASQALLEHRLAREEQIVQLLHRKCLTLDELVNALYGDRNLGDAVWVAKRTAQAHLARLIECGRVRQQCLAPEFRMRYVAIEEDQHS